MLNIFLTSFYSFFTFQGVDEETFPLIYHLLWILAHTCYRKRCRCLISFLMLLCSFFMFQGVDEESAADPGQHTGEGSTGLVPALQGEGYCWPQGTKPQWLWDREGDLSISSYLPLFCLVLFVFLSWKVFQKFDLFWL